MDIPRHDFGQALSVDAEAIGRPGQRRFRMLVRSASETAAVWMEKQQLAGIGTWFEEVCERLDKDRPTGAPDEEPLPFGEAFDLDFRAAQVALGYSEDEDVFIFQAFEVDTDLVQQPGFRCSMSRGQARVLSRKIAAVVAAGRPICPLCNQPMDPDGHVCPRSNGHSLVSA
jgi:uncharacterized repeat protein (TIGR03847 family)